MAFLTVFVVHARAFNWLSVVRWKRSRTN